MKMASTTSFLLVLALAFAFSGIASAGEGGQVLRLKSEVGDNPGPVKLTCNVNRAVVLDKDFHKGENYKDQVKLNKAYSCVAVWVPHYFAAVGLFDPARDKGRATIYWKVDEKGWYLSSDDKIYDLVSPWETE